MKSTKKGTIKHNLLAFILIYLISVVILPVNIYGQQATISNDNATYTQSLYNELPLGHIKPTGWIREYLTTMLEGSTGHLDETYAKLSDDNGWLGGSGDHWEETPYWLDGAAPLAYLLQDQTLKDKVQKYINWTIENQRPSGYFGPYTSNEIEHDHLIDSDDCHQGADWWPRMIMLKVLQQYYSATNDDRVINLMTNYFNYQLKTLRECPLNTWTTWAASRGTENALIVLWLYEKTGNEELLELCDIILEQAFPWAEWLGSRDYMIAAAVNQTRENWMHRHGVNVGMGLKDPIIKYARTGDVKYLEQFNTGWKDLMTLHGLPNGMYSADEDLNGNLPTQGTELCAVVETMFSLEKAIIYTGDIEYLDALERIAYNILPAQTTDDLNLKQYYQIANQVEIRKGVFNFVLPFNREMNNVFGVKSGYTCCMANMHQGMPKFVQNMWYKTPDSGLLVAQYGPNEVSTLLGDNKITIIQETAYPFDELIRFHFKINKPSDFPLYLRIPAWCEKAHIVLNGETIDSYIGGQIVSLNRTWMEGDILELQLPMNVTTSNWARNSRTIERGPLIYGLRINEQWERGYDDEQGEYYSVYPTTSWNYGILRDVVLNPEENSTVTTQQLKNDFKWNLDNAPIEIKVPAKKIPGWVTVDGVAHQPVTTRIEHYQGSVDPNIEYITLIPYGFTKLRIVAFPVVPSD